MDDTSMQVQLYFNGRNLKDLDFFSKSDPYLKLYMQRSFHGNLDYIGRTQTINDSVNPNWKTKIDVQYYFQMQQPIKIQVYDQDDSKNSDFIGKAQTTLGKIMGSTNQATILTIQDNKGKSTGNIIVRAQKIQESSQSFKMKWKGGKIANVDSWFDFWDKSDPYLKFLKIRGDNTYLQAARTQVKMDNQQPSWNQIVIPMNRLLNSSNPVPQFKVQCWDHEEKDHEHQFIGEVFVSVEDTKKPCPIDFTMHNPKLKKPGKLTLQKFEIVQTPNFIDYLKSGLQLNLVIAIDFTGSNGSPTSPTSLHYLNPNQPTQYQTVMNSIWGIIQNYDTDKRIPAFGFGAKPKYPNLNQASVNHCFPLSGNYNNIQIQGFQNLMGAYTYSVQNVELSGPTLFGPLLQKAFVEAKKIQNSYGYQVLLILTDGQIHDMKETVNIIVQNSHLPMSIIIVGIGNAGFENMNTLDGDQGLFSSTGKKCPRDIVQFVPFNKFGGNAAMMTQQILRQLPKQVVQYMTTNGKQPQPKPPIDIESMLPPSNKKNVVQNVYGMMKQ